MGEKKDRKRDGEGEEKNKKRAKKKKMKLWKVLLLSFVVLFIGTTAGGYIYVSNMLNKMEKVNIDEDNLGINDEFMKHKGIKNIALFGVDSTEKGTGRSDAMMILTVDGDRKKVKVTSLMRDSYVEIKGRKERDKLNHAYAFGGPELAIRTINESFGLNIKDFVTVDFTSLPKIIDILGGIEVDIDSEELKYINFYINELNGLNKGFGPAVKKTGLQKLDGIQAMAYCRIRYTSGGDYKRTERHREILDILFKKILETPVSKYPTILNEIMPMVKTNMSSNEILSLGTNMVSYGGSISQDRFPKDVDGKESEIDKVYYLEFDEKATKEKIQKWIFQDIKSEN